MAATLRPARSSDPVPSLDAIGPGQAKAGLRRTPSDQSFTAVFTAAILKHYGSVKCASISLDVDPSLMMREFEAGKFGRLNKADADTKAAIADALAQTYGTADPKAKAQRAIRAMRASLDDLAETL